MKEPLPPLAENRRVPLERNFVFKELSLNAMLIIFVTSAIPKISIDFDFNDNDLATVS